MKTKLLLFRAMYIMAMIASLLTLPITAAAQAPIPFLIAFPADNAVEGWEWPEGETVQITIDNAPGLSWQGIAQVTTWGDPRTYFRVEFGGEYDLQTNDIITLSTDGVPPVSHQVQNLTVTDVNGELDTVSGAADIGALVQVWPHGYDQDYTIEETVTDGTWLADFGALGFSAIEESGGQAQIMVEGNATAINWNVPAPPPSPWLSAFPVDNAVEGWEWPEGETVQITIDNAPGLSWQGIAQVTTWGDPRTYFRVEFGDEYDLQTNDIITLSTEGIPPVSHQVQNLTVTDVNGELDTVSGAADIGVLVQVWPHGYDQDYTIEQPVTDGTWLADFGALGFSTIEESGGRAQIMVEENATAINWNVPAPPPESWRDEFDGPLAEEWYWVNENPEQWSLDNGFLTINASPYQVGDENMLLRPVDGNTYAIETHLLFNPAANYQVAGLVIFQSDGNYLMLGRAFCDAENGCVGNGIYFDHVENNAMIDSNFAASTDPTNEAYLRLERQGERVRGLFSPDGITWIEIGTHWIPDDYETMGVGLIAAQDYFTSEGDDPADFNYFELSEGWNFLPEGFHDYDKNDVPAWACNVGGWAADPDDRNKDLAIQINIDDTPLPDLLSADEYREDLEAAEVCHGGECAFFTSVWDAVTHYEPHTITVYAQDISSGDWIQLANSPKQLTCRTYDIYGYDPLSGETITITQLTETDEYNPAWSPNGKQVAHDVVNMDGSQAIFITEVKTGISAPLLGAEDGGNDPAWSPNGKWIAFDLSPIDQRNLYLVPAQGGTPSLIRENAVSADWAPNGKRVVFQDMTDGSIRTISVDSKPTTETIIAPVGSNPAWSPDGNWIAFEAAGDIWKVQVNIQGTVFSQPVRVTEGTRWDSQPAWTPDSLSIIYHAGLSRDADLWIVPAAGGQTTWLTGGIEFGDYDPSVAANDSSIAYASFTPDAQAPREWVAAFTYDLPGYYWPAGMHAYRFGSSEIGWSVDYTFNVWDGAPYYNTTVLIRPTCLRARLDGEWIHIDTIHPAQHTQFHIGWTTYGSYAEALDFYGSLNAVVAWDEAAPVGMIQHEIFPLSSEVDWDAYFDEYAAP